MLFKKTVFLIIITESPGSTVGATTIEISIDFIAECINRAHKATKTVKLVLENMVRVLVIVSSLHTILFLEHRQEQEMSLVLGFPIWLGSSPRLTIRRELASVSTLVS